MLKLWRRRSWKRFGWVGTFLHRLSFYFKKGVVPNSSPSHYKHNSVIVWPLSPSPFCSIPVFYIVLYFRPSALLSIRLCLNQRKNRNKLSFNSSKDTVRLQLCPLKYRMEIHRRPADVILLFFIFKRDFIVDDQVLNSKNCIDISRLLWHIIMRLWHQNTAQTISHRDREIRNILNCSCKRLFVITLLSNRAGKS